MISLCLSENKQSMMSLIHLIPDSYRRKRSHIFYYQCLSASHFRLLCTLSHWLIIHTTIHSSIHPHTASYLTMVPLRNRTLLLLLLASTASASLRPQRASPLKASALRNNSNKNKKNKWHTTALTTIRGGSAADLEMAGGAFDWCANLGAPAALVGGAVLATLAETREEMAPKRRDSQKQRLVKQVQRFLLLSAFALEIISIFATTVTGTMLLSQGDQPTGIKGGDAYHSPMVSSSSGGGSSTASSTEGMTVLVIPYIVSFVCWFARWSVLESAALNTSISPIMRLHSLSLPTTTTTIIFQIRVSFTITTSSNTWLHESPSYKVSSTGSSPRRWRWPSPSTERANPLDEWTLSFRAVSLPSSFSCYPSTMLTWHFITIMRTCCTSTSR